jgi:hypothetical protein
MSHTELIVRGLLDKLIEDNLTDEQLSSSHKFFESFKPAGAVRGDRRDAIFGYIMGVVMTRFYEDFQKIFKRAPNLEETKLVVEVITKQIFRIKSRIDETYT